MKIRHYLLQKPSILIWVSVLSGFFVTSEEIMDCIELSRIRGIDPEIDSILLLIFQCLFFILFTRILLQINVCWQPEKKRASQAIRLFVAGIRIIFLNRMARGLTRHTKHKPKYPGEIRAKRTERKPPFHGKKLFYLFHEPEEAWYNNLFTLFVGIYTFSRIYILAARKEEVERNYEKLKNESLQSQIDALYNQINPHFFFNALNSLHALIVEDRIRNHWLISPTYPMYSDIYFKARRKN